MQVGLIKVSTGVEITIFLLDIFVEIFSIFSKFFFWQISWVRKINFYMPI